MLRYIPTPHRNTQCAGRGGSVRGKAHSPCVSKGQVAQYTRGNNNLFKKGVLKKSQKPHVSPHPLVKHTDTHKLSLINPHQEK